MEMTAAELCKLMFSSSLFFSQTWLDDNRDARRQGFDRCESVVTQAIQWDVNPAIALSLAYSEGKLKVRPGRKGKVVGSRIDARWTCGRGNEGFCDLEDGILKTKEKVLSFGCFKDLGKFSRELKKKRGAEEFMTWVKEMPVCSEPDWSPRFATTTATPIAGRKGLPS